MLIVIPCNLIMSQLQSKQAAKDCQVLLQPAGLSDDQKLDIVLNFAQYNPAPMYHFPNKVEYGKNHSFQHHYLQSFPCLGYSAELDGCLCLPCCLFSSPASCSKNFVHKAYSNWTKLNDKVKAHSSSSVHLKCVIAMENYKDAHSGKQLTIDTSLDQRRKNNYDLNCQRLDVIIDCVILCGKQNIPFRGHSDADSSQALN